MKVLYLRNTLKSAKHYKRNPAYLTVTLQFPPTITFLGQGKDLRMTISDYSLLSLPSGARGEPSKKISDIACPSRNESPSTDVAYHAWCTSLRCKEQGENND